MSTKSASVQFKATLGSVVTLLSVGAVVVGIVAGGAGVAVATQDIAASDMVLRQNPNDSINWGKVARVTGSANECRSLAVHYPGGYCQPSSSGSWLVMVP